MHSSTLVTTAIYLLIRFSPSFGYLMNVVLLLISGLTIFMAGLGANFEYDLKKMIALSTLRQLGLITASQLALAQETNWMMERFCRSCHPYKCRFEKQDLL